MEWDRSDTLVPALDDCAHCGGMGMREGRGGALVPCNCVMRGVFRACYRRFRYCMSKEKHISRVSLEFTSGRDRRMSYGRKDEEFCADFYLVSKRHLDETEFKIFRFHFLLGADWKLCCRKLGMDRGNFFHAVYRIEHKLGRVFRELEPYGLYPLDEYFNGTTRAMEPRKVEPIRPAQSEPPKWPWRKTPYVDPKAARRARMLQIQAKKFPRVPVADIPHHAAG